MKKVATDIIILVMWTKNQSYDVRFLRYRMWEFFVILGHFLPFYLPNDAKRQNFYKMKKTPGDINILYIYILNKYHMMHDSWNVRHNRQFLSFRTIFCPFTTLTTQKIKILKNWKKDLEILSFYKCVPWMTIISYIIVPGTWSAINISFYHFGRFFALLHL